MASVPIALGKLSIDSRPRRVCAVVYLMRGIAYDGKKDDDRAIADFMKPSRSTLISPKPTTTEAALCKPRGLRPRHCRLQ